VLADVALESQDPDDGPDRFTGHDGPGYGGPEPGGVPPLGVRDPGAPDRRWRR
jgi:hypothetical protein